MFSITHEGEGASHVAILRDEEFGSEVRVAVGLGFNVFSFRVPEFGDKSKFVDVLYAEEGFPKEGMRATSSGTPILVPFPNRIAGGKFTYDGKTYTLPCNDHGVNAIHGMAFDRPWRIIKESTEDDVQITGEFEMLRDSEFTEEHWPGNFRVRCEVHFSGNELLQKFHIKNLADVPIPFGLGTHPYFRLPFGRMGTIDDCLIDSPARTQVVLEKTIPTGETRPVSGDADVRGNKPIGGRKLDDVYTDLETPKPGEFAHSLIDVMNMRSLHLIHSAAFRYSVVYIPPHRQAICIEPYTCVTNAVNLGDSLSPEGPSTGLWRMRPGEEFCFGTRLLTRPVKGRCKE